MSNDEIIRAIKLLTREEKECVLYFEDAYDRKEFSVLHSKWPIQDHNSFHQAYQKFTSFGFFNGGNNADDRLTHRVKEFAHFLKNPEKPNYPKILTEWWFSKKLSIPITILVIVPPFAMGWINLIQALIRLFAGVLAL